MPEEYVTKLELNNALTALEKKMESSFSDVNTKLNQIINAMELKGHTDRETYDERYILREESMAEAVARVGTPQFRQSCYPIVTEYLNTEDGKRQLSCIIDSHFAEKRDSATKWINFIKLVGGIIIAAMMLWGGQTIVQTNLKTQQTVIEALHGLGD